MVVPFFLSKKHPYYRIYIAFMPFFIMVFGGTLGYMLIEDYSLLEAVYMTIITMSTVGFMEVQPLSEAGRIFTIGLIFINITLFTLFVSYTTRYFLDGRFQTNYKLWRMIHSIEKLKDHVIICGFGRNGQSAAQLFANNNIPFVVIEKHFAKMDHLKFPVDYYLTNDATNDQVMLDAGIKNAKALITTLPDDAENVFIVLTARELNPNVKIISRASNDSSLSKLKTAGAHNVIMPDKIGGLHMATLVMSPDVNEFMDYLISQNNDQFRINEITASRNFELGEMKVWDKTGATVLGIRKQGGSYILNPVASTEVNPGDRLIVMGSQIQLSELYNLL